jgi:hypothetical protein
MEYGYLFGNWRNESRWSTWVYWHLKMVIKRSKQYGLVLICSRVDQKRLPLLNNCPFPMANKKKRNTNGGCIVWNWKARQIALVHGFWNGNMRKNNRIYIFLHSSIFVILVITVLVARYYLFISEVILVQPFAWMNYSRSIVSSAKKKKKKSDALSY